jgi:hypothetical protein
MEDCNQPIPGRFVPWGPFESCAAVNGNDCRAVLATPAQATPSQAQATPSLEPPSCSLPSKKLKHDGSISSLAFLGITSATSNFFNPYSSVAVGKDYILQAAGTQLGIYSKTGRHYATIPVGDNIFHNTVTQQTLAVLYDPYSDRFIIAVNRIRNTDDGNSLVDDNDPIDSVDPYIAVAITKGSNPLSDGWYRYMLPLKGNKIKARGAKLTPLRLGAWHNGIYLTIGLGKNYSRIVVINREPVLCGQPLTGLYQDILSKDYVLNIMPPNAAVTFPLQNENAYFLNLGLEVLTCIECKIDWNKNTGVSRQTVLYPKDFRNETGEAAQPLPIKIGYGPSYNTGTQVQAQYSRVDNKSSYWVSSTNGNRGLIWLELEVSSGSGSGSGCRIKIVQEQTIPNVEGLKRFSSGMAVNKVGNVLLVATQSSQDTFPSTVYFFRFANDPPSLMTKGQILIKGTGSNSDVRYPPDKTSWGFTTAQVDPVDTTTFYVCGEWYKTSTSDYWYTTIYNLKL